MEVRDVLFGLHEIEDVGWKTIELLYEHFADLRQLFDAESGDLRKLGIRKSTAERIVRQLNGEFIEQRKALYDKEGIRFMTVIDERFPIMLRESPHYPWVLYYRGDASMADRFSLAIVGTRVPTQYGRVVADSFASELAAKGICIVSGMARGIDSIAHRAALRENGPTIAVLGTSLDRVYPEENRKLFAELVERGLVVTEYPLGTASHANLFPQRNRIIAGLSYGTIFVEGKETSGACHTVRFSLDAGRDVFVVPGQITSPNSIGPMRFIRKGEAHLVLGTKDILDEYKYLRTVYRPMFDRDHTDHRQTEKSKTPRGNGTQETFRLSEEEGNVLDKITAEPVTIDELLTICNLDFGHLHSILLSLTMKKQIVQLPGSKYIRNLI